METPVLIPGLVIDDSACEVDDLAYCGGVQVTVPGDTPWPDLVERSVTSGWVGLEGLAGFKGTLADAVRGNWAAYGYAVADHVASVRTWDLERDAQVTMPAVDCRFGTGTSRLQEELADGALRYRILDVAFLVRQGELCAPIIDPGLAELVGVPTGGRVAPAVVRYAVLHTVDASR